MYSHNFAFMTLVFFFLLISLLLEMTAFLELSNVSDFPSF